MKYNNIVIVIFFILLIACIINMLLPQEFSLTKVINFDINMDTSAFKTDAINERVKKIQEDVENGIVNNIPKNIIDKIIDSTPKEKLLEKCTKLQQPKTLGEYDEIIYDELPVDEKVNTCKMSGGYIDDIEIERVVFPAEPKIILY
jgi:uncharacterized protein YrrD